jgi:ribosome-binding factor A
MQKDRIVRINDNLKKEISIFIQNSNLRERCGLLTINHVDSSRDLSKAKVFFSSINAPLNNRDLQDYLNENSWLIRKELSHSLPFKKVPELRFLYDEHLENVRELNSLINDI